MGHKLVQILRKRESIRNVLVQQWLTDDLADGDDVGPDWQGDVLGIVVGRALRTLAEAVLSGSRRHRSP